MARARKSNKEEPKGPGGRPTKYTKELAERICGIIACCTKSIKTICSENPDFPAHCTIHEWKLYNKEFADQYMRAKASQADLFAEEILDISDDSSRDSIIDENGNERINSEYVARSRLRVDSRKWIACKLLPKVYGDKSEVTTNNIEEENLKAAMKDLKEAVDILKKHERAY